MLTWKYSTTTAWSPRILLGVMAATSWSQPWTTPATAPSMRSDCSRICRMLSWTSWTTTAWSPRMLWAAMVEMWLLLLLTTLGRGRLMRLDWLTSSTPTSCLSEIILKKSIKFNKRWKMLKLKIKLRMARDSWWGADSSKKSTIQSLVYHIAYIYSLSMKKRGE